MKTHAGFFILSFVVLSPSVFAGTETGLPEGADPVPVYSVSEFDPSRNPEADLTMTMLQARDGEKHIILDVGGAWCGWCKILSAFFQDNRAVSAVLAQHYVIMKVNFSNENRNEEFLARFPKIPGYPHLFVLDHTGKLLHTQGTGDLEEGHSYNEEAVLRFLNEWKPKADENEEDIKGL